MTVADLVALLAEVPADYVVRVETDGVFYDREPEFTIQNGKVIL